MTKKNYIIGMIIIGIILLIILPNKSMASELDINASIGDIAQLDKGTLGFYTIQKKKSDGNWIYITYSIIKYQDNNGKTHVGYCLDENAFGVGYVKGDVDGYAVKLTKLIENEKIWRVIINGYPYKTPEELGVETEDDAYLATKRAVYSMISGYTEEDVRENYRVGQTKINGQDLSEIQRRGEKVINTICKLVNIGNNGTQTLKNELKIIKIGELKDENNQYYQEYKVASGVEISEYNVNINNLRDGVRVVDEENKERTVFKSNEKFRVIMEKDKIESEINEKIEISAKCKTYPVYYAEAPGDYQDYAICSGYWDTLKANTNLRIETNKATLKIIKKDKDTGKVLEGVKFKIQYEDGRELGEYITDEKGEIYLEDLSKGKIIIYEIETQEGYLTNKEKIEVEISLNEEKIIEIQNEKIPEEPKQPKEPEITPEPTPEPIPEKTVEKLPRTGEDNIKLYVIISDIIINFCGMIIILELNNFIRKKKSIQVCD